MVIYYVFSSVKQKQKFFFYTHTHTHTQCTLSSTWPIASCLSKYFCKKHSIFIDNNFSLHKTLIFARMISPLKLVNIIQFICHSNCLFYVTVECIITLTQDHNIFQFGKNSTQFSEHHFFQIYLNKTTYQLLVQLKQNNNLLVANI